MAPAADPGWEGLAFQESNTLADNTFVRRRPRPPQLSQGSPSQDRPPGQISLSQGECNAAISQEGS